MAEQKAKPAVKKVSSVKAISTAAAKTATTRKNAAPAAKKAAAPAPRKKVPEKKPATASPKPVVRKTSTKPTPEERYLMVQTAAYFIAERNGFGGCATEHWATAEAEIANRLRQ